MADEQTAPAPASKPALLRGAIVNADPKIVLTFFLTIVAALLFIFLAMLLVYSKGAIDAGTVALFASLVTVFIKMAADSVNYHYGSSAGSDRKDVQQAKVADRLAEKVASASPAPVAAPWWSVLTDDERAAITAAAPKDPRIKLFVDTAMAGKATADDLAYLVAAKLLTPERASAIATA